MENVLHEFLIKLVNSYQGGRLRMLSTGGGLSVAELGVTPGSSKIFSSLYVPYEVAESSNFLREFAGEAAEENFKAKAVSAQVAENFLCALETKTMDLYSLSRMEEFKHVAITASLISNRWRRGDNKAFIAFDNKAFTKAEVWQINFPKIPEELHNSKTPSEIMRIRKFDDETTALVALSLACNIPHPRVKEMKNNGTLSQVAT